MMSPHIFAMHVLHAHDHLPSALLFVTPMCSQPLLLLRVRSKLVLVKEAVAVWLVHQ